MQEQTRFLNIKALTENIQLTIEIVLSSVDSVRYQKYYPIADMPELL